MQEQRKTEAVCQVSKISIRLNFCVSQISREKNCYIDITKQHFVDLQKQYLYYVYINPNATVHAWALILCLSYNP